MTDAEAVKRQDRIAPARDFVVGRNPKDAAAYDNEVISLVHVRTDIVAQRACYPIVRDPKINQAIAGYFDE
jgi:hypothetical protein